MVGIVGTREKKGQASPAVFPPDPPSEDGPYRSSAAPLSDVKQPIDCPEAAHALALIAREGAFLARRRALEQQLSLGCRSRSEKISTAEWQLQEAAYRFAYSVAHMEQRSIWTRWIPRTWYYEYGQRHRQYIDCLQEAIRCGVVPRPEPA